MLTSEMSNQARALQSLKDMVEMQEQRMRRWERDYFPQGRIVQPAPPPTPTEEGDLDMQDGDSQMLSDHEQHEVQETQPASLPSTLPAESQEHAPAPSEIIQRIEHRSLRQQCERVVGTATGGNALRPFGARS